MVSIQKSPLPAISKHFNLAIDENILHASLAMVAVVAASNYLVQLEINEWLTWGAFTYPFTFLIVELTNRYYGPKTARQVVWTGFIIAVTLAFVWMNQRIAFASSTAFLVGQLLDIRIFNQLRRKSWWVAPASASIAASLIDTTIFFSFAFAGEDLPWITLGMGDFLVKLMMDLVLLLPFRMLLWRNGAIQFYRQRREPWGSCP